MALVKLFQSSTENLSEKESMALRTLEVSIGTEMLMYEILSISGPHANFIPPSNPGDPVRVFYTATVVYKK